jgi:hypothetical protein
LERHDRALLGSKPLRLAQERDDFGLALSKIALVFVGQDPDGRIEAQAVAVELNVHVEPA